MSRFVLLGLCCILTGMLSAQLSVSGGGLFSEPIAQALAVPPTGEHPLTERTRRYRILYTRVPAPASGKDLFSRPAPFDYAVARPYLAFFCRLELNIEAATTFPVRFRLGEVRGWQQQLSRRE